MQTCFYVLYLYCRVGDTVVKGFETLVAKVEILVLSFHIFSEKSVSLLRSCEI